MSRHFGANDPIDPTLDEELDLPATLQYLLELPTTLTKWMAVNIQRLMNQTPRDWSNEVRKAMPHLIRLKQLIDEWVKNGAINRQNEDLKTLNHWWELFMYIYGDRAEKG